MIGANQQKLVIAAKQKLVIATQEGLVILRRPTGGRRISTVASCHNPPRLLSRNTTHKSRITPS